MDAPASWFKPGDGADEADGPGGNDEAASALAMGQVPPDAAASPDPGAGPGSAEEQVYPATAALSFGSALADDATDYGSAPGPAGNGLRPSQIIDGVYCPNGHFEDPEAQTCAVCGVSMNQQTLIARPGPRPPLGVLILDDGNAIPLDGDYVAGREPTLDDAVAAGEARPLLINDPNGIVSRVHARVHLEGWRVLVTDLGSANGTRVLLPHQMEQQLLPKVPIVLPPGSRVDLGGAGFAYESRRGASG
jgi:hypothetical protein